MGRRGFLPPSSRLASSGLVPSRLKPRPSRPRPHPISRLLLFSKAFTMTDRENAVRGKYARARCFRWPSSPRSRIICPGFNLSTFFGSCISRQFFQPRLHIVLRKRIREMINGVLNEISPIGSVTRVLNRCYSFTVNVQVSILLLIT